MARLFGWLRRPKGEWPDGRVVLPGVELCAEDQGAAMRRRGLRARLGARKGDALGIVGGYVLPAEAASDFMSDGCEQCSQEVEEELDRRAGDGLMVPAWRVLACSYMADYYAGKNLASRTVRAALVVASSYLPVLLIRARLMKVTIWYMRCGGGPFGICTAAAWFQHLVNVRTTHV